MTAAMLVSRVARVAPMEDGVQNTSGARERLEFAGPSDRVLVARVLRREEGALDQIYTRYGRLVYAIALRITGDIPAAEEVVQDVFQAVWQSIASFQPDGNFVAWLIGIARHRAIDATRSRRFRSRSREEVLDDERIGSAGFGDGQHDHLLLRAAVRQALLELPPAQRQAIELAFYGGLTHAEIAAQLGQPIGTIKSRLRIGMVRLRDLLSDLER